MSGNDDEVTWEEHSIDEELLYTSGESDSSTSEGSSSDTSSKIDETESVDELDEVRGAEPYRFEPVRTPHESDDQSGDDDASEGDVDDQNRLDNTEWYITLLLVYYPESMDNY